MQRLRNAGFGLMLGALLGCSSESYVPVSGVVTLDGKPYPEAVISFQPIGSDSNPNPGRGSSAYTDETGRFELISDDRQGAVIGKHLVRIMTRGDVQGASPEGGSPDETSTAPRPVDPIPVEWNAESNKQFDVPPGGTTSANFDIQTKAGG